MGKSPGRWIKAVLFGKKHSKSRSSRNCSNDKRVSVRASQDPEGNPLVISSPRQLQEHGTSNAELENGTLTTLSATNSFAASQSLESRAYSVLLSDADMQRQNQAAAKAQAAFRGYLARRAFRALKGIIRLQAVIRGHLVRRQAVATLFCMQAIVKLQAVVRVRLSGEHQVNVEAKKILNYATNSYVHTLLRAVPTAMSLSFQYEDSNTNSSSSWLDRWSHSRFWAPPTFPREVPSAKHRKKTQHDQQVVENDSAKTKRNGRRSDHAQNGDKDNNPFDMKRNTKKGSNHHQSEPVQEHPQYELERIKRNLRKISAAAATEKPHQHQEIAIDPENTVIPAEDVPVDVSPHYDPPSVDAKFSDNAEEETENNVNNAEVVNEEMSPKEEQKARNRRSLPAKTEINESPSQNTTTPSSLPSYMAATQSAKAKLRASGSSKLSEDGAELSHIRRHSLPLSGNGKLTSFSPRIQLSIGKGSNKSSSKATVSSRDDKLAVQPGWRR